MKRISAFLLILLTVFLCSCGSGRNEPETTTRAAKTADMLVLSSNKKNYSECVKRYHAVLSAVKNKISILEAEHNKSIQSEHPDDFFLTDEYIPTGFDPFVLTDFTVTEAFDSSMDTEKAKQTYSSIVSGAEVQFENDSDSSYILRLVTEEYLKEYEVDYSSNDSFRFFSRSESGDETTLDEMLEFAKNGNTYYIQSLTARLFVQFDGEGNIVSFSCATLKDSTYKNESFFPKINEEKDWVTDRDKSQYLNIHTYENGVLIHEDCSSGPWKTVSINENNYANAFVSQ